MKYLIIILSAIVIEFASTFYILAVSNQHVLQMAFWAFINGIKIKNMGTQVVGESNSVEYSTPLKIVQPLINEFGLTRDVCASALNHKLPDYWTKEDNSLAMNWEGNCWMNPPFSRDLNKWVKKACNDAERFGGTKVCLIPVRSNTKWWAEVCVKAEIRFINGEVNFNDEERGLWLPMCIIIFGEKAKVGTFSVLNYR